MAWGNRILRLPYHLFPVKLGAGSMTAHNFDRFLALWFWKSGSYAQNVATFVDKFCLPGMQVVDIGANIGFFTMYLAKAVGENGKVWAFEPEAKNYANLINNINRNRLTNVVAVNKGVGKNSESGSIWLSPAHSGDHRSYQPQDENWDGYWKPENIEIVALDDYFAHDQKIDLVKIDTEGSEWSVLRGMQKIMTGMNPPKIFMEFWPHALAEAGTDPGLLLKNIRQLDYQIFREDEISREFVEIDDIDAFVTSFPEGAWIDLLALPIGSSEKA
jgi:FkbM family methyltransferase